MLLIACFMTLSPVKCPVSDTNRQLNVKQAIFYYLCCDTIMTVWKLNVWWAYSTLWISLNFCSLVSLNLHCGRDLHVCPVLKVEKWFHWATSFFNNRQIHLHTRMHTCMTMMAETRGSNLREIAHFFHPYLTNERAILSLQLEGSIPLGMRLSTWHSCLD